MRSEKYICKKQIFEEFGISKATFYRYMKRHGIAVSRHLLSPAEAEQLRSALYQQIIQGAIQDETR